VIIDESVRAKLEQFVPLAPLHQPHNLAVVDAVREWQADLPQVACFDTAFHRSHPALADVYALPWKLYESGVRRYGFHGLSYEFIASTIPSVAPEIAKGRVVVAHLGNGASLCALKDGRSVDCSMGFSTLDGVPMGTRPGAVDPGVLLYLLRQGDWTVERLEDLLYHKSGLLGLSGVSSDMRDLLESADPRAQFSIDYFVSRVAREIGALAASLGGLDGIVFTAGIGENSPAVRARIIESCAWLGVILDPDANAAGGPRVSKPTSRTSAWVIQTNEEFAIARHTLAMISRDGRSSNWI
jgi:acetate kinase